MAFLDETGLQHFWTHIVSKFIDQSSLTPITNENIDSVCFISSSDSNTEGEDSNITPLEIESPTETDPDLEPTTPMA